jgi:MYXO-CTERM domain-containing protein
MSVRRLFSVVLPVASLLAVTSYAQSSRADLLPPNSCTSAEGAGSPCNNAGPNNEPGVCVNTTCPHSLPDGDGGISTSEEPCILCQVSDAGPAAGSKSSSSGGCSASPSSSSSSGLGLMLAAAVVAGAVQRRRRAA